LGRHDLVSADEVARQEKPVRSISGVGAAANTKGAMAIMAMFWTTGASPCDQTAGKIKPLETIAGFE
jgi:hypothetical protein